MQKRNERSGLESLLAGEVAERQALERQLRQREERLNHLFNSVPVGLAVVDSSMRYLRVNETLARINGRPAEEHKGRTIHEIVPHIATAVESVIREALTSRRPILNLEVVGEVFAAPGQTRKWLLFFIPLTITGGGDAVAVLVYEAGGGLHYGRAREEKYAALFEHTSDAVLVADAEGRLLEANPGALRLLGYDREELRRLSLRDVFGDDASTAGLREGASARRRCRVRRRDGSESAAELMLTPVGGGEVVCIVRLPRGGRLGATTQSGVEVLHEAKPGEEMRLLKDLAAAMSAAVESLEHAPPDSPQPKELEGSIRFYEEVTRFERDLIRRALRRAQGNQKAAADALGINATTLHAMLKRYDINPADFKLTPPKLTMIEGGGRSE